MKENFTLQSFLQKINLIFLLCCMIPVVPIMAQDDEVEDKTYSPRFYLPNSDTTLDALPLKSTSADVTITGVIADVTVKQVYTNEGTRAIEAKYVFPASTRAAIYYLHMRIGNRLLVAKIEERKKAQEIYQQALEEGATATLLEQMTPNVFQMNVANILPGDTIEIEMKYTELLVPTGSVYEFVFPTVVGPRYTGGNGDEWTEGPYQHENEDPLYDFGIHMHINAGMPISEINCVSNPDISIVQSSPDVADISPNADSSIKGNKDFILQYRLAGNAIQTGFLAYPGQDENFFLAMMQPPQHPDASDIPPREYVFIMDVSGSMNGFPISVSKTLLTNILQGLRVYDKFNILFFAGGSYLFRPQSVEATQENIDAAITAVNSQVGGGATELLSALDQALALKGTEDFSRIFLILTDGYVTVEKEAFDLIRNNLGNANFFSFGIGTSVSRYIIEGMAHAGQGEPFIATSQTEANQKAELFREYVNTPVLTKISAEFKNFEAYDVEPLHVPDIFAERPVILYGKYHGVLTGTLDIDGTTGNQNYSKTLQISDYKADENNKALMYLWARKRVQLLDDYCRLSYSADSSTIDEIIRLGLKYDLLTAYTSFIVVDSTIRCDTCTAQTVHQPLPMPDGVSDNALGSPGFGFSTGIIENSYVKQNADRSFLARIYPNPVTEQFVVSFFINYQEADLPKSLQIVDMIGRLVKEIDLTKYSTGYHTLYLSIANDFIALDPANYFVRLTIDKKILGSQIITIL